MAPLEDMIIEAIIEAKAGRSGEDTKGRRRRAKEEEVPVDVAALDVPLAVTQPEHHALRPALSDGGVIAALERETGRAATMR